MKKIMLLSACAAAAVALSACSSTEVSKISAPALAESKTIVATPDVASGEKISGEGNVTSILGGLIVLGDSKFADGVYYSSDLEKKDAGFMASLFSSDSAKDAKSAAAYDACAKSGADIVLIPNYVVEKKNYIVYSVIKAQVTGFKGTVNGVKQLECKDYKELYYKAAK